MPQENDPTRSASTQPYRATKAARLMARQLRISADGRTITLRPLADVLSQRTRETLGAITKGGQQ